MRVLTVLGLSATLGGCAVAMNALTVAKPMQIGPDTFQIAVSHDMRDFSDGMSGAQPSPLTRNQHIELCARSGSTLWRTSPTIPV